MGIMSKFWTTPFNPVLPTLYDDNLSYYEFVKKIFIHMQEFQKAVNAEFQNVYEKIKEAEASTLEQAKAYTDAVAEGLEDEIEKLQSDLEHDIELLRDHCELMVHNLDLKIERCKKELENKIMQEYGDLLDRMTEEDAHLAQEIADVSVRESEHYGDLLGKFAELNMTVTDELMDIWFDIDTRFEELKEYIDTHINQTTGDKITVINPVTGLNETLNKTLRDIYNSFRWGSLSAKEYDDIGLSAAEYDAYKMSAFEYDNYARFILFDRLYLKALWCHVKETDDKFEMLEKYVTESLIMINPLTGKDTPLKDVLYDIVNKLHRDDALSAEEYDLKELSAQIYDEAGLSAYEYDFHGKTLLP